MYNIKALNKRLADHFGLFDDGQPNWRVVFSETEMEKRFGTYEDRTPSGLLIRVVKEVREVPKYRHYIKAKYILERLIIVPQEDKEGAPVTKLSYEPLWVFEAHNGKMIEPKFEACKFIIDKVMEQLKPSMYPKYAQSNEDAMRADEEEFRRIYEGVFGNETEVADALHYGKGVFLDSTKRMK